MIFKLNMEELGQLVRSHIETQYGRRTGRVQFYVDNPKTLNVEAEDTGPVPKATPAPTGLDPEETRAAGLENA
jgi:hypothetical protein